MKQLITPQPIIPATGGWCLMYVRQAFGLPARYASATEAWEASSSKHRDRNFPANMWTPVWYGIAENPLGHVVLRAPSGEVYSTSDYSGWPVIHSSLADLEAFYAFYGMTLQYRGWTEDVASYAVMSPSALNTQSTPTPVTGADDMTKEQYEDLRAILVETQVRATVARDNSALAVRIGTENQRRIGLVKDIVTDVARSTKALVDYDKIDKLFEENVADGLKVDVSFHAAAPVLETEK